MAEEQDKSHRLLFSHPQLVEELIRHFVAGPWVECLDFETLEKVSERDLSPELVRREKDLLWRLRWKSDDESRDAGDWFYVFLHLEFQSEPQPFMALRMCTYRDLFYEDLVRRGAFTSNGLLPPVYSLVLYNGKRPWREACSLEELVEKPPGFEASELPPGFSLLSYHLIEERAIPREELEAKQSAVAVLFQLEQSRNLEDLQRGVGRLQELLPEDKTHPIRESFATWLSTVLLPMAGEEGNFPELRDLTEVDSMLQQSVIEWRDGWLEEGRQEGEVKLLLRLLKKKFGAIPDSIRRRVEMADAEQLLSWEDRILTVQSLEQLFAE